MVRARKGWSEMTGLVRDDGESTVAGVLMTAEMAEQPQVLAGVLSRAGTDAAALRAVLPGPLAGTMFLARGSSDNAAVFGRYLAELRSGRPAGLMAPSLYTRYHADVDWSGFLVVALSQSGATPEIVRTCADLQAAGAVVIGLTNLPGSPLAQVVDRELLAGAGPERAVPATKTVTAQLALLVTVTSALTAARSQTGPATAPANKTDAPSGASGTGTPGGSGGTDGADETNGVGGPGRSDVGSRAEATSATGGAGELAALPDAVAAVLYEPGPARQLAEQWKGLDRLVVAGRGLAYAAALETALKIKETTGILAEGMSTADLLHGPIATVYAGAPVLLIEGGGPADTDLADLRDLLTARGAEQAELPLPPGLPETAQVITAVVRGQQLARELALARGADPDAPAHLSKITATT
jgi:glutamine---fructose-6-phosphate transaminase (isomerizing)